jgi:anthranilate phosphoribosyltransferase
VVLNAAAALTVAGVAADLGKGVEQAREVLTDGRAAGQLERVAAATAGKEDVGGEATAPAPSGDTVPAAVAGRGAS